MYATTTTIDNDTITNTSIEYHNSYCNNTLNDTSLSCFFSSQSSPLTNSSPLDDLFTDEDSQTPCTTTVINVTSHYRSYFQSFQQPLDENTPQTPILDDNSQSGEPTNSEVITNTHNHQLFDVIYQVFFYSLK